MLRPKTQARAQPETQIQPQTPTHTTSQRRWLLDTIGNKLSKTNAEQRHPTANAKQSNNCIGRLNNCDRKTTLCPNHAMPAFGAFKMQIDTQTTNNAQIIAAQINIGNGNLDASKPRTSPTIAHTNIKVNSSILRWFRWLILNVPSFPDVVAMSLGAGLSTRVPLQLESLPKWAIELRAHPTMCSKTEPIFS